MNYEMNEIEYGQPRNDMVSITSLGARYVVHNVSEVGSLVHHK